MSLLKIFDGRTKACIIKYNDKSYIRIDGSFPWRLYEYHFYKLDEVRTFPALRCSITEFNKTIGVLTPERVGNLIAGE